MNSNYKQILRGLIKTLSKLKHSEWIKWGKNLKQQIMNNTFDKQQFIVDIQQYWVEYDKLDDKVKNMYDVYQYNVYKQKISPFVNQLVQLQHKKMRQTVIHFIALMSRIFAEKSQIIKYQGKYYVQIQLQCGRLFWGISEQQLRLFTNLNVSSAIAMQKKDINNIKIIDSLNLYKIMQQNNQNLDKLIIPSSQPMIRYM